MKASSKMSK